MCGGGGRRSLAEIRSPTCWSQSRISEDGALRDFVKGRGFGGVEGEGQRGWSFELGASGAIFVCGFGVKSCMGSLGPEDAFGFSVQRRQINTRMVMMLCAVQECRVVDMRP